MVAAMLASFGLALEPVRQLSGPYRVDRVIDGDTISVVLNGRTESVRLIGIDTPETVDPGSEIQPFGPEASRFTEDLLRGRDVWLERDVELRDRYDRLLAYAYVQDPRGLWEHGGRAYSQVNLVIAMSGYADQLTIPPNVQYADLYQVAVRTARIHGIGMWAGEPVAADGARGTPGSSQNGDSGGAGTGAGAANTGSTFGSTAGGVRIACIFFDPDTPEDRGGETVTLEATASTDVSGWVLHDEAGHTFRLPPVTLQPGESLVIPNPGNAVWNNGGDTATLRDGSGRIVDSLGYDGRGSLACR